MDEAVLHLDSLQTDIIQEKYCYNKDMIDYKLHALTLKQGGLWRHPFVTESCRSKTNLIVNC